MAGPPHVMSSGWVQARLPGTDLMFWSETWNRLTLHLAVTLLLISDLFILGPKIDELWWIYRGLWDLPCQQRCAQSSCASCQVFSCHGPTFRVPLRFSSTTAVSSHGREGAVGKSAVWINPSNLGHPTTCLEWRFTRFVILIKLIDKLNICFCILPRTSPK